MSEPAHVCRSFDGSVHYVRKAAFHDAPGFPGFDWKSLCGHFMPEGAIQNRLVGPPVNCLACIGHL